jgi:hypothetical protein
MWWEERWNDVVQGTRDWQDGKKSEWQNFILFWPHFI